MLALDVFWSFRSPYSYLAIPDLKKLQKDYELDINLRVVLPIAVRAKNALFDANNRKPAMYILKDSFRRAEFLGIPIGIPSPDPVVQNMKTFVVAKEQPYIFKLSALAVEAARRGCGLALAESVSKIIWSGEKTRWDQGDHLAHAVAETGHSLMDMEAALEAYDPMETIEQNHEALDVAGHWGVPTCVLKGEPFFGQDRIDTLRWRLEKLGIPRRK